MSLAIHKEIISNTNINLVLCGKFVDEIKINNHNINCSLIHQLLLVRNYHFDIYEIIRNEEDQDKISTNYKFNFLIDYKVFGSITAAEKTRFHSESTLDSIIIVMEYAKIAIVEYDINFKDFTILCLYNLENENLSNGKKFYKRNVSVISSITYNSVFLLSNENVVTILLKKTSKENSLINNEQDQIKYLDTLNGEKYFEPSFYINFNEYGINKIIKFYVYNKENENLDYFNQIQPLEENEKICILILYRDSKFSSRDMTTGSSDFNTTIVANPNFYKFKINLGVAYISRKTNLVESFEILFENLDQNSFDLFCLSTSTAKITIVLAPYSIQIVNYEQKICYVIILNQIYIGVFHREYTINNINNVKGDITYANLNTDLRGGGFLPITNTQWLFTTSNGCMNVFSFMNNFTNFKIDQIHTELNNELVNLESSYKFICMPSPGVFFLGSHFSDGLIIIYDDSKYIIVNKMINISPIINFICLLDKYHTKFIFTSGYNKLGMINFLYEKFIYDISFITQENQEISYLQALNFKNEIYSRYLLIYYENGSSILYEVGKSFINISDKVSLIQGSKIITVSVVKIIKDCNLSEFVFFVYENLVQIFDSYMKLVHEIPIKDLTCEGIEERIKQIKVSDNTFIINTFNDKFIIFYLDDINSELLIDPKESQIELNENICLRYFDITSKLYISDNKILNFDINSKLIMNKIFLVIYRESSLIQIFDIYHSKNKCINLNEDNLNLIENDNFKNPFFENNIITELPIILYDSRIKEHQKDFEKSLSDLTANLFIPNNAPHVNTQIIPEDIFFDVLDTKIIFSIVFNNGTIVFYEAYFILNENKIFSLKMKKIFVDFIKDIDYRELFYKNVSNFYIRFNNINDKSGLLVNIKGNQKLLFEVNGRLKFFEFEDNSLIKRKFSAFSELSKENNINGFIFYENRLLTIAKIPTNFEITEVGLIKRNILSHFPVNLSCLNINQESIGFFYYYITVERELKLTTIKSAGGSINLNKFIYHMCLRFEDPKIIDIIEFSHYEIIIESKIVELMDIHKQKKKYIAVGINITDERGEEVPCKGKIHLYNIENGKFVKILESEIRGVISMIHSIEGILIISEGSKIYLYQYMPLSNEIKKISVIDNKNLVVCSKIQTKFIITGDIFESASWIVFKHDYDISNNSIYILGKDQNKYHSTSIDFWIDDTEDTLKTGCILADDKKNLHIFLINVNLNNPFSEVADIHLGKTITELRYFISNNNKSVVYYSASDGSIGLLKPISRCIYERLSLLCEYLYNHLPFRGGLNPKAFFSTYSKNYSYSKEKGNIIDWEIINYYLTLSITAQKLVAKNIISSREEIINNINDLKN